MHTLDCIMLLKKKKNQIKTGTNEAGSDNQPGLATGASWRGATDPPSAKVPSAPYCCARTLGALEFETPALDRV